MNVQDDISSIPIEKFKDHYVHMFNLSSRQDATESCRYTGLVAEPLRLKLKFTFLRVFREHVIKLIVLGE